jgi:hypothetical protein
LPLHEEVTLYWYRSYSLGCVTMSLVIYTC